MKQIIFGVSLALALLTMSAQTVIAESKTLNPEAFDKCWKKLSDTTGVSLNNLADIKLMVEKEVLAGNITSYGEPDLTKTQLYNCMTGFDKLSLVP